jgi:hypothetical protein
MLDDRAGVRGGLVGVFTTGWLHAAVALAVALALLALRPPADAGAIATCSRVYHKAPTGNAPGPGRPPLLIGDSVVGFAMPKLQRIGYRINAQGCRTFPRGITALKREAHRRKLPRLVVFELGTAGDVTQANIDRVLEILGPKRELVLVTPRVFRGGVDPDAADYYRAAERDPRVLVIPWAEYGEQHPEWFYPDQVHPNDEGVSAFVKLLKIPFYV